MSHRFSYTSLNYTRCVSAISFIARPLRGRKYKLTVLYHSRFGFPASRGRIRNLVYRKLRTNVSTGWEAYSSSSISSQLHSMPYEARASVSSSFYLLLWLSDMIEFCTRSCSLPPINHPVSSRSTLWYPMKFRSPCLLGCITHSLILQMNMPLCHSTATTFISRRVEDKVSPSNASIRSSFTPCPSR
jgi:hypothetical protein